MILAEGLLETVSLLIELSIQALAYFFGSGVVEDNKLFTVEIIEVLPVLALLLELLLALRIGVAKEIVEECALS